MTTAPKEEPKYITIAEIAHLEGVSERTIRRRVDEGAIPVASTAFQRLPGEHRRVLRRVYLDLREAASKGYAPRRVGSVRRTGTTE